MTELDLNKLREIAEAATPGPWEAGMTTFGDPRDGATHACVRVADAHWTDHLVVSEGCAEADRNMAHIATFDPPTVLALIDELEQLHRWKREAKQVLKGLGNLAKVADAPLGHPIIESAIDEIERLRGVVEQVRDLAESYPPIASTRPVGAEAIRIYERYVVARKILAILGDHLGGGMK